MIYKILKPDMSFHCKQDADAKSLLNYLDRHGYTWNDKYNSLLINFADKRFQMFASHTCYKILKDKKISCSATYLVDYYYDYAEGDARY